MTLFLMYCVAKFKGFQCKYYYWSQNHKDNVNYLVITHILRVEKPKRGHLKL